MTTSMTAADVLSYKSSITSVMETLQKFTGLPFFALLTCTLDVNLLTEPLCNVCTPQIPVLRMASVNS